MLITTADHVSACMGVCVCREAFYDEGLASTHACAQDDRVVPAHSFKMAAALQTTAGASPFQRRPLLVRIESNAGHGAGKPTSKVLAELADTYSFLHTELAKSK